MSRLFCFIVGPIRFIKLSHVIFFLSFFFWQMNLCHFKFAHIARILSCLCSSLIYLCTKQINRTAGAHFLWPNSMRRDIQKSEKSTQYTSMCHIIRFHPLSYLQCSAGFLYCIPLMGTTKYYTVHVM